jgi:cysteinyl-tRNA synthetase
LLEIPQRNAARQGRDFRRADEIRADLLARGIALKDSAEGTSWGTA